jgi:glutathionyl-hydroquinone reductase
MSVDGKWTADCEPVQATDAKGGFVGKVSGFPHWVTEDSAAGPTGKGARPRLGGNTYMSR